MLQVRELFTQVAQAGRCVLTLKCARTHLVFNRLDIKPIGNAESIERADTETNAYVLWPVLNKEVETEGKVGAAAGERKH